MSVHKKLLQKQELGKAPMSSLKQMLRVREYIIAAPHKISFILQILGLHLIERWFGAFAPQTVAQSTAAIHV
jgi:hypothetical protein